MSLSLQTSTAAVAAAAFGLPVLTQHLPPFWELAFVAGCAGGLTRALTLQEGWKAGARSTAVGAMLALFGWPLGVLVVEWVFGARLNVDPVTFTSVGAYVSGLTGVGLVGLFLDFKVGLTKGRSEGDD